MMEIAALCIAKLIFFAICGSLVYILLQYARQFPLYIQTRKMNGPKGLPFIGNALEFLGDESQILDTIMKLAKPFASPVRVWLGFKLVVGIFHPEQLKIVLNSPNALDKGEAYKFGHAFLGTGLVTAPSKQWQIRRKLIAPALNLKIVESYVQIFAEQSQVMIDFMKTELHGREFNTARYIIPWTTDITYETLMGISIKTQVNQDCSYLDTFNSVFDIAFNRAFKIWLYPDFIFNRTSTGRKFNESVKFLHRFTEEVIRKKKLLLHEEGITLDATHVDDQEQQRKTYIYNLVTLSTNGKKLSDLEIRDEIATIMAAASDTVYNGIRFAMFLMANYPAIQETVYKELYEIYGAVDPANRPVTKNDLPRMKYLECFIKETLRLFPPGRMISRTVTDDIQIGSWTIPKGSHLLIPIFLIHRTSEYWPNPLTFDPNRFLPENSVNRHPYSYLAFSGGLRNCIGARYAMFLMKTGLATILRRYRLKRQKFLRVEDISLSSSDSHTSEILTVSLESRIST